jgi:hypothetical protein
LRNNLGHSRERERERERELSTKTTTCFLGFAGEVQIIVKYQGETRP